MFNKYFVFDTSSVLYLFVFFMGYMVDYNDRDIYHFYTYLWKILPFIILFVTSIHKWKADIFFSKKGYIIFLVFYICFLLLYRFILSEYCAIDLFEIFDIIHYLSASYPLIIIEISILQISYLYFKKKF